MLTVQQKIARDAWVVRHRGLSAKIRRALTLKYLYGLNSYKIQVF